MLLIDDFLANGEALKGLMDICRQAECHPVGAGICIEKCFQPGGETLRGMGLKVVSLAAVEKTENGKIRFLGEEYAVNAAKRPQRASGALADTESRK